MEEDNFEDDDVIVGEDTFGEIWNAREEVIFVLAEKVASDIISRLKKKKEG